MKDSAKQIKIHHVITRMILGGAQENTLLTVLGLKKNPDFAPKLITGPALGPEGSLIERACAEHVDLEIIPQLRRAINPLRDYSSLNALTRIFKREKPDIVHTHSSKAGIIGREAARRAKVPVIIHTIHGLPFHKYQKPLNNWLYITLEKRYAKHTTKFISVADAMTEEAVASGIAPKNKYTTIYSGMEIEPFLKDDYDNAATRKRFGLAKDDFVVCKVARLFHLKGQEFVLRALPEIARAVPNIKILFVGNGILRANLEREAARLGVAKYVVFAGLLPTEDIPGVIHASDAVVHTSLWEGLPRVMPQALLSGKPVVCYDIGGAREVVLEGKTGFLLPPESVKGLAEKVIRLAKEPALRERMGTEGRSLCAGMFSADKMVAQIAALYKDILGRK